MKNFKIINLIGGVRRKEKEERGERREERGERRVRKKMIFYDKNNNKIDNFKNELKEQLLCYYFIEPDDIVLELGARYGTVSCIINKKLNDKNNQVSVEPDKSVWKILETNIKNNNCKINLIKGAISNKKLNFNSKDYGSYTQVIENECSIKNDKKVIKIYSLEDIQLDFNLKFNVLVADCEGCLENFFNENKFILFQLKKIIYEMDRPNACNYDYIKELLYKHNFINLVKGHQNVWIKKTNLPLKNF
jgi:FkbM family methyltransferase